MPERRDAVQKLDQLCAPDFILEFETAASPVMGRDNGVMEDCLKKRQTEAGSEVKIAVFLFERNGFEEDSGFSRRIIAALVIARLLVSHVCIAPSDRRSRDAMGEMNG